MDLLLSGAFHVEFYLEHTVKLLHTYVNTQKSKSDPVKPLLEISQLFSIAFGKESKGCSRAYKDLQLT